MQRSPLNALSATNGLQAHHIWKCTLEFTLEKSHTNVPNVANILDAHHICKCTLKHTKEGSLTDAPNVTIILVIYQLCKGTCWRFTVEGSRVAVQMQRSLTNVANVTNVLDAHHIYKCILKHT